MLRVRNNLHEAGWPLLFRKNVVQKPFFCIDLVFLWRTVSSRVNNARDKLYSIVYSVMVSTVQVNELPMH